MLSVYVFHAGSIKEVYLNKQRLLRGYTLLGSVYMSFTCDFQYRMPTASSCECLVI